MLVIAGCDRLPTVGSVPISAPADVVTDNGRGTYDWNLNRLDGELSFDVARQTTFKFVERLDTAAIQKNIRTIKFVEPAQPSKPEWMEDDVYEWFRRFTEPQPETEAVLTLKADGEVGNVFELNRHGTRLLTLGTKLIEWDVETGKRLREFPAPVPDGRHMMYDTDEQSIVLRGVDKLHRVSLSDGQIKYTWTSPDGELKSTAKARDKDVVAVVTHKMGLYALAANFTAQRIYKGEPLINTAIAVHPDGRHVVGTVAGRAMRWQLNQPDTPVQLTPADRLDQNTIASSGAEFDRWTTPSMIHEINHTTGEVTKHIDIPFVMTNGFMAASGSATLDGPEDWLVVLCFRGNFDGTYTRYMIDVLPSGPYNSVPWVLPMSSADMMATNWNCEVIALKAGEDLQVFKRRRWVDPDGARTAIRAATLLSEGRCDQLDKIAEYFRAQAAVRGNRTGQSYYGLLADFVGARWEYLEAHPPAPEIAQKIEQWRKGGSQFAQLASAVRHQRIGLTARGDGYADSVSPENWKILEDRIRRCNQELKPLLRHEEPPAKAFEVYISNMKYSGGSYSDAEPLLKKYTELYPQEYGAYTDMCLWLLPRWGGTQGEGGALVGAVADRLPSPESELFYSQIVLDMTGVFQRKILPETGLNETRAVKAAELMMQREQLTTAQTELLMELAYATRDQALGDKLGRYHIRHFDLPARYLFFRPGVNALFKLKDDSLKPMQ